MNRLLDQTALSRERIDATLDRLTQFGEGCPERLTEAIRYSLLSGGKRLRPLLVLLACEACGGQVERALPAAAAVEMIHAYSLIHDDLPAMDDDDLRRGQPTNHRKFGEATAILAGDGLLTRAFEVLATEVDDPQIAVRLCQELAAAAGVEGMVGGQQADLAAEREFAQSGWNGWPDRGDALQVLQQIHARKTGALITAALRMGGIVANGSAAQLDALRSYGSAIGLAFQITDDLLDCEGDEQVIGKRVGADAAREKLTYPSLLGLEGSRQEVAKLLESAEIAVQALGKNAAGLRALAVAIADRDR